MSSGLASPLDRASCNLAWLFAWLSSLLAKEEDAVPAVLVLGAVAKSFGLSDDSVEGDLLMLSTGADFPCSLAFTNLRSSGNIPRSQASLDIPPVSAGPEAVMFF